MKVSASKPRRTKKSHEFIGLLCEELDKWSLLILKLVLVTHGLFYALKLLLIPLMSN